MRASACSAAHVRSARCNHDVDVHQCFTMRMDLSESVALDVCESLGSCAETMQGLDFRARHIGLSSFSSIVLISKKNQESPVRVHIDL